MIDREIESVLEEIEEILSSRNPLYENAMNFCIDTDKLSVDAICGIIIKRVAKLAHFQE